MGKVGNREVGSRMGGRVGVPGLLIDLGRANVRVGKHSSLVGPWVV